MNDNFQNQPQMQAPKRNLPRDVFLHIFAMVALYWVAISFITLCWQYINYFFPDVLALRYGGQSFAGAIRFAVASLIIMFPLYIFVSWYLNKVYKREVAVRESKIRKWLIYLTLFVAALLIVGDLVSVIYNFLGGEITLKFILKAFSVLVVAGVVFSYYLDDVRKTEPSKTAKIYAWAVSAVILITVIGAFFIVGSPANARLAQLDQQRSSDLQGIQYQIVNYWQRKGALPNTLADLNDPISSYVIPNDPETNMSYEYNVKDAANLKFELCAVFSLEGANNNGNIQSKPVPAIYPGDEFSQNWQHPQGRTCFERMIDKQLYPVFPK
ncbi:MAG: DUF5671 domain-containing protein [bacterium]|nr:DUF5671 domain-containing protein [bacterium]